MTDATGKYCIMTCGPFRLVRPDGQVVQIVSRKSRALLIILAVSSNYERQRGWLAECLWGSRGTSQRKSSLRHELSKLSKLLEVEAPGLISITRETVRLHRKLVWTDVAHGGGQGEFAEGIRFDNEPVFCEWLDAARDAINSPVVAQTEIVRGLPAVRGNGAMPPVPSSSASSMRARPELAIAVLPVLTRPEDLQARVSADQVLGRMGFSFRQLGGVDLFDLRWETHGQEIPAGTDIALQCSASSLGEAVELTLSLIRAVDKSVLWTQVRQIDNSELTQSGYTRAANELSDQALNRVVAHAAALGSERELALVLALEGVETMFSLSARNLTLADEKFARAYALVPSSAFLAWRAYLAAHWLEELDGRDPRDILKQAQDFESEALRLDPHNGLTLSLLAHVNAFVFRDFNRARELLDQAHALQSNHVMTYDAEALLSLYTGDLDTARQAATKAAEMGRFLPFRYAFVTTMCMIDALTGDYQSGIRNGKLALALQPQNNRKQYPPTLRYLGSCYAKMGKLDEARETFDKLAALEPKLNSAVVGSDDYPVPSPTAAALISSSLEKVGL